MFNASATLVTLTKRAEKSLGRAPRHVAVNFLTWKREIETHGLDVVQKIPGYHDEPLKGVRSIWIGLGYRAYYWLDFQEVRTLV